MKQKKKNILSKYLDTHTYPGFFYRFPVFIILLYWLNHSVTLRNWYVLRRLKILEKEQQKGFTFFDAGCGMGEFVIGVARRNPESKAKGVDYTASNIPLAIRAAENAKRINVEYSTGDLSMYRERSQYDLLLCNSVLQFIREDKKALANLHALLRNNRKMLLYVPIHYRRYLNIFKKIENKYLEKYFYTYHNDFVMHRYTEDELFEKIREAGFIIKQYEYSYGIFGALSFEIYSLLAAIIRGFPAFLSIPITLVYALCVFPIQIICMGIDYSTVKSSGNGILIIAEKKADGE